ncbi:MAG: hypothetical protein ACFFAH_09295 [Promethearchaeota archaeon]
MLGFRLSNSFYFGDDFATVISLAFAVVFIVFAIFVLIRALQVKGGLDLYDVSTIWLVFGILSLVLPIAYAIIIHFTIYETSTRTYTEGYYTYTETIITFFWNFNYPFLGIILIMIGGILIIIAAALAKKA